MTAKLVEHCMGTVFSLVVRDEGDWTDAVADVVRWLHRVDALLSTYQPGSDLSRVRRGEITVAEADPLLAEVLELCAGYESETNGYFTAHLPGGLDPTGLVKGWAVERASQLLRDRGSSDHAVNGGGDVQVAGGPWRIGISDPHDAQRVLTIVAGHDFAVATSGTAERGAHLVDPHTGDPVRALASVSVVDASLTRADVYATAAFAMGSVGADWLATQEGCASLVISADGSTRRTGDLAVPGLRVEVLTP